MKTIFRYYSLMLIVSLLSAACHREEDLPAPHDLDSPYSDDSSFAATGARYGCQIVVLPTLVEFNYIRSSFYGCTPKINYVCYRPGKAVFIPCIIIDLPPIPCRSCPYDIAKILPIDIFEDFRKINPEIINSKVNGVTFPITESVVGLQFYTENKIINRYGFYLHNDLLLSAEEQKALGVTGGKIPAGKYPVIYNPKSNTFNAIVSVK